ncbi:NERD domain-containing protein [Aneurinibacillus thermoaerophilus]|uniref:NERD domain-containing protein n=1 Tax=Aneurinibacillus thermoaerophilus TaxID=143495 RepID=A0ABX8Y7B2_ANETH|nr:NERD domain-containing protein [Aneurinibacillus thermoaerophilus]QYY41517.1 NERD domain-containing protein [Aneurinibacillus thermoaerophilus]
MEYILLGSIILLLFILAQIKSAGKKKRKLHRVPAHSNEKAERKGQMGEAIVQSILSRLGNEYISLHDVMIQGSSGRTAQIDHIVLSPYGIFVLETKAYSSYVKGYEDAKNWVQFLKNGQRHEFYNPIKQNEGHIRMLQTVLNDIVGTLPFVSIVVFVGTKDVEVEATKAVVVQENELLAAIQKHTEHKLSVEQVHKMADVLWEVNITSEKTRKRHVTDIQKRAEQVENGICPSCSSPLVERTGQYGVFLGCSGYPRCKFKVSVKRDREVIQS